MAKKANNSSAGQQSGGAGLSAEVEVVTSIDQGQPGNRLAVVTEILVFVDGRLTKVKRGHVRTLDITIPAEKPAKKASLAR